MIDPSNKLRHRCSWTAGRHRFPPVGPTDTRERCQWRLHYRGPASFFPPFVAAATGRGSATSTRPSQATKAARNVPPQSVQTEPLASRSRRSEPSSVRQGDAAVEPPSPAPPLQAPPMGRQRRAGSGQFADRRAGRRVAPASCSSARKATLGRRPWGSLWGTSSTMPHETARQQEQQHRHEYPALGNLARQWQQPCC